MVMGDFNRGLTPSVMIGDSFLDAPVFWANPTFTEKAKTQQNMAVMIMARFKGTLLRG
jgi:hypothetical protein